jgi:hypothetical protein
MIAGTVLVLDHIKEFKMKFSIICLLFLVAMAAQATQLDDLSSYQDLENLISNQKVTSIDQLLPLLPEKMKKNSLLIYNSHALHTELVTALTPRIVLFNKDGSLVMTVSRSLTDDLKTQGQDQIEVLNFNSETARFEMRALAFNGKDLPPLGEKAQVNPATCLACHGENPRPIFQDYNAWPGIYGSFSAAGASVNGTPEYKSLTAFLNQQKNQTNRYSFLDLSNFTQTPQGYVYRSRDLGPEVHPPLTPALRLGQDFERLMFRRLAKKILSRVDYPTLEPLFIYLGVNSTSCSSRADRAKELTKAWVNTDTKQDNKSAILTRINDQIEKDYKYKTATLNEFNSVDLSFDDRGIFSAPYFFQVVGADPHYPLDLEFFKDQLYLMETLFQYLALKPEDITTMPDSMLSIPYAPTIGIFHIRADNRGDENANYFWGLADALIDTSHFPTVFEDCEQKKAAALNALIQMPSPNAYGSGGLF